MVLEDDTADDMPGRFLRHLDPDRVRTNAEIQLFADVFSLSFAEARWILTKAGKPCEALEQRRSELSEKKNIVVFFHGDADTGKTTTLKRLAEILREKSTDYHEVKSSPWASDKRVMALYKGVGVGIGTAGDSPAMVNGNLEFFERNHCAISFTAARHEHRDASYAVDQKLQSNLAKFDCVDVARNQASKSGSQVNVHLFREDDLFLYLLVLVRKRKIVPFQLS